MANEPSNTTDSLQTFFVALANGHVVHSVPTELLALASRARRAVRADASAVTAEDLLQELFTQICERAARMKQRLAEDLAALGGRELRLALHTRLRQAACAKSSTWNQRRALASHVRDAFAGDVTVPTADRPISLSDGNHLCGDRVRLAVRWAVAQKGVGFDARRVIACLWTTYFQSERTEAEELHSETIEDNVVRLRVGEALRRSIQRHCAEDVARAFVARYRGFGYQRIAEVENVSVATAFARVERATAIVRQLGREFEASPQNVEDALELLAA